MSDSTSSSMSEDTPHVDDAELELNQGHVYNVAEEALGPYRREVGIILHDLADDTVTHLVFAGRTGTEIASSSNACIERIMRAAILLAERGFIDCTIDNSDKAACQCWSCIGQRSWMHLPYDPSRDQAIAREQRIAELREARAAAIRKSLPAPRPGKASGYVYLLKSADRFKIGISQDFDRRLSQLKMQSPYPVELVHHAYGPDYSDMESHLHRACSEERAHGEWFSLSPDQVAAVIEAMNEWARDDQA